MGFVSTISQFPTLCRFSSDNDLKALRCVNRRTSLAAFKELRNRLSGQEETVDILTSVKLIRFWIRQSLLYTPHDRTPINERSFKEMGDLRAPQKDVKKNKLVRLMALLHAYGPKVPCSDVLQIRQWLQSHAKDNSIGIPFLKVLGSSNIPPEIFLFNLHPKVLEQIALWSTQDASGSETLVKFFETGKYRELSLEQLAPIVELALAQYGARGDMAAEAIPIALIEQVLPALAMRIIDYSFFYRLDLQKLKRLFLFVAANIENHNFVQFAIAILSSREGKKLDVQDLLKDRPALLNKVMHKIIDATERRYFLPKMHPNTFQAFFAVLCERIDDPKYENYIATVLERMKGLGFTGSMWQMSKLSGSHVLVPAAAGVCAIAVNCYYETRKGNYALALTHASATVVVCAKEAKKRLTGVNITARVKLIYNLGKTCLNSGF